MSDELTLEGEWSVWCAPQQRVAVDKRFSPTVYMHSVAGSDCRNECKLTEFGGCGYNP